MKKYRVSGTTVVTVYKEVWANNEDEAYDKAFRELNCLTAFCGNGGTDKLVGVYGDSNGEESINADDMIEYDDIEELEDDPSYFECPECGEQCENVEDANGTWYWWCNDCYCAFDDDGNEFYPDTEEDEEEEE